MEDYSKKLCSIFENVVEPFSYDIQRNRQEEKNDYLKEFDTEAKKYVDDIRDIVHRGGEELIRRELRRIEKEIRDKLSDKEKFKNLHMPDDLTARLRVLVKGYEYTSNTFTKGE